MPQNTSQRLVFLTMMAAAMTAAMETYNQLIGPDESPGLTTLLFHDFPLMMLIVMAMQSLFLGPIARRIAFMAVDPQRAPQRRCVLAVSVCTVLLMCPAMSAAATLLFKPADNHFFAVWSETLAFNLPMALLWQLAAAGPGVRWLFRRVYARQLAA